MLYKKKILVKHESVWENGPNLYGGIKDKTTEHGTIKIWLIKPEPIDPMNTSPCTRYSNCLSNGSFSNSTLSK